MIQTFTLVLLCNVISHNWVNQKSSAYRHWECGIVEQGLFHTMEIGRELMHDKKGLAWKSAL